MEKIDKLWQRGKEFLGVDYAILCGAMSWVSERNLVSAISNAGGFGVIACGSMSVQLLEEEILATQKLTSKNFGVNLIVMHPDLDKLMDVCIRNNVKYVVLAGGIPKSSSFSKLKEAGIKIMSFAPALSIAKKLIKMGTDALIIEGMEAGGHIGSVSTIVLAQEILPNIKDIPVFVAGGIGRGDMIAAFLELGAVGCQLGTRFVCATESIAHPNFKRSFIRASARDAMPSVQINHEFPVIPVRAIANNATKNFIKVQLDSIEAYKKGELSKEEAVLKIEHFWAGALRKAVIDGDIENGSIMAGQSVAFVEKEQPAAEIIQELLMQAIEYLNV